MSAITLTRMAALAAALILSACGGGGDDPPPKPEITSCSRLRQGDCSYSFTECANGASSFDVTVSQSDLQGRVFCSAEYHLTCSGGCIATVTER